jgi:hypothetical protein
MSYVVQNKPLGNPYFGMVLAHRTVAAIIKNDKKIDVVPAGTFLQQLTYYRYKHYLQLCAVKKAEDLSYTFRLALPSRNDRRVQVVCFCAS